MSRQKRDINPKPISITVRAIRMIGMVAGLAVTILTSISLSLLLVWCLWYGLAYLELHNIPFYPEGLAVYYPDPYAEWVSRYTIRLTVVLLALFALLDALIPMSRRIYACAGIRPLRLPKDHPASRVANQLSSRANGPPISVWLLPVNGITAFALRGPLANSQSVVMSQELLNGAPEHIRDWVIAHEVAHIVHDDTRANSSWLLFFRSIRLFLFLRQMIMRAGIYLIVQLPFLKYLAYPLVALFSIIRWTGRIGQILGVLVFKITDRFASRRMEFAADAFAYRAYGAMPGIQIFSALTGDMEPSFNLFATHPSLQDRVLALQKLHAESRSPSATRTKKP